MPEAALAPSPQPATPGHVEYATGPARQSRHAGWVRLLVVFTLAGSAGVAAWVRWGPGIRDRVRLLQVQRACGRFTGLPGQPVIPQDEATSRYDLTDDWLAISIAEGWRPPRYHLAHRPRCLDEYEALLTRLYGQAGSWRTSGYGSFWAAGGQEATAFLHQLKTGRGEERLVIVSGRDIWPEAVLHASVLKPASWGESAVDVSAAPSVTGTEGRWRTRLILPEGTRLYVGQHDPGDPSHFTLPYTYGIKRRGTIDGWLIDGSTVVFQVRDGPLAGLTR